MESSVDIVELEDNGDGVLPIRQRPEWSDIEPCQLSYTKEPVVQPLLDPCDADLLAYFWAAMKNGEMSERMLALSGEIIQNLNSAHYSVWEWRWRCIEALGGTANDDNARELLLKEADFMKTIALENPKNYQLWNHRRKFGLARGTNYVDEEMSFTESCLIVDAKNYHAWAHRQAMISAFGGELWRREMKYTELLLRDDPRNNSAWTQRIFVLTLAPNSPVIATENDSSETESYGDVHDKEIAFVTEIIRLTLHNEAAWVHFENIIRLEIGRSQRVADKLSGHSNEFHQAFALASSSHVFNLCQYALEEDNSNVPALRLLSEYFMSKCYVLHVAKTESRNKEEEKKFNEAFARAKSLAKSSIENIKIADPMRKSYWNYREQELYE